MRKLSMGNVQRLAFLLCRKAGVFAMLSVLAVMTQYYRIGEAAGGKRPQAPDYPAKVEFRNAPGDRILSIGDSIYRDGETNSEGVVDVTAKIVATTGGLSFDTQYCTRQRGWVQVCSSLGRYHFFDFCQAVNTVNPLPTANGWVDGTIPAGASFMTDPLAADGVTRLPNGFKDVMSFPGEQRLSAMKANFTDSTGSSVFTLRFTPNSYPESNYLLVTYRGGSLGCGAGTPCASWTVEALDGPVDPQTCFSCAAGNLQAIAALQDNSTYYGAFHMPFMITITVLPTP